MYLKNLGTFITINLSKLIKDKFLPVTAKAIADQSNITYLCLIVLQLLKLIASHVYFMPTPIPSTTFNSIHGAIGTFIWNKKRPRMALQNLQLPIKKGGLALPNFKLYHWSSQLKFVLE